MTDMPARAGSGHGQNGSSCSRQANHGNPVTPAHPAVGQPGEGRAQQEVQGLAWRTTWCASWPARRRAGIAPVLARLARPLAVGRLE